MISFFKRTSIVILALLGISCLAGWILISNRPLLVQYKYIPFEKAPFLGVNYYSQNRLWRDFWEKYSKYEVVEDFMLLDKLDLRVVRIFLYQEFFTHPSSRKIALENLTHLVSTARENNLKIIVTFFDWSKPYSFEIKDSQTSENFYYGAYTILEQFAQNNTILMWDLKNEPDHDFKSDGKENVASWFFKAHDFLKSKFPGALFTIGWLWLFKDVPVNEKLNILSFHHFPEQGSLKERILQFRSDFPNKPILLEEVGYSVYQPKSDTAPISIKTAEQNQSRFIESALMLSLEHELTGVLIWNLNDHSPEGGPKRPPHEDFFGIIRQDKSYRPFANKISQGVIWTYAEDSDHINKICVSASGEPGSLIGISYSLPILNSVRRETLNLKKGINCFAFDTHHALLKIPFTKILIEAEGLRTWHGTRPAKFNTTCYKGCESGL